MEKLLGVINNGDLTWAEVEGAKIIEIDESIIKNEFEPVFKGIKELLRVKMIFLIDNVKYEYNICTEIIEI